MSKPLLSTSFPQSNDFVFDPQSSTPNEQRPRGGVRQDNTAPVRDRIASLQPASPKNTARPHHMDGKISRLQRRSTKRQTVSLTVWLSPEEKLELQRLADSEGLSFSQTGRRIIIDGLVQKLRIQREVTATPAIEAAMHKEMTRLTNNLAEFQGRILFEVSQLHWLSVNRMYWEALHPGKTLTEKEYRGLLKTSMEETMKNLHRYIPQIAEFVSGVKKWFAGKETQL